LQSRIGVSGTGFETKQRGQFDLVVLCAVWRHLDERQRDEGDAFGSIGAVIAQPPNPPSASEAITLASAAT
jgi:hypothetical protein